MQRYIDDDLNQQETSLMMDHVGQCPDCAAMLVKLQQLSSELTQLPRVVPRYSLVDAILPELNRLQAAQSEGDLSKETSTETEPAVPTRSNRPKRDVFRKLSGVIAAGVIVGLLLVSQPQNWFLTGGGSHNDAASAPAPMAFKDDGVASSNMLEGDISGLVDSAGEMQTRSASDDLNNKVAESDVSVEPTSKQAPSAASEAAPEADSGASALEESSEDNYHLTNQHGISRVSEEQAGSIPDTENPTIEDGSTQYSIAGESSSIPAETSDSRDGKWRAIAVSGEGTIQVYKIEDESQWYQSVPRVGVISLLSWNDDSTLLYYTNTDLEGHQTEYVFDVVNLTESIR